MIRYFDRFPDLDGVNGAVALENTIAILRFSDFAQDSKILSELSKPHKFNFFIITHKIAGSAKIKVDMVEYDLDNQNQYMINIAPGKIVSVEDMSEDFDARVILMSTDFIESLMVYMGQDFPIRRMIADVNKLPRERDTHSMEYIITVLSNIITDDSNPYRRKVLEHILMVIFYGSERTRNTIAEDIKPRTSADVITLKFINEVKNNFKTERQLGFYAESLCITPRYLSRVVKETTGSSAAEWIERYVVLEARALLKSTNLSVQQISDELNFPSQTFFGKYFKRRVGMSPKEYRRIG